MTNIPLKNYNYHSYHSYHTFRNTHVAFIEDIFQINFKKYFSPIELWGDYVVTVVTGIKKSHRNAGFEGYHSVVNAR